MLASLVSLLAFLAIAFAAFGCGRPIVRSLGLDDGDSLSIAVWSLVLGLLAGGAVLMVNGAAGYLTPLMISVLTAVACFWGVMELVMEWGMLLEHRQNRPELPPPIEEAAWIRPSRPVLYGFAAATAGACLAMLLAAMAPPSSSDVLRRLELPQRWLVEQRLEALSPSETTASFQSVPDIWFVWALGLEGGVCVQLVAWGIGILAALATVLLATPILGRPWAWVAGMLVALTPGVMRQIGALDGHVAAMMLCTLAVAAWRRAAVENGGWRWYAASGAALGGAIGSRMLVPLLLAAAMLIAWNTASRALIQRRRTALDGILIAGLVAAVTGAVWSIPPVDGPLILPRCEAFSLCGFLLSLYEPGIVVLVALPGLLWTRPLRGLKPILIVLAVFALCVAPFWPRVELALSAAPLLATAAVWVVVELRRLPIWPRRLATTALAVGLAATAMAPWGESAEKTAAAIGWQDRDLWLARRQPIWRAAEVANRLLPATAHILSQDPCTFFFQRRVTTAESFRRTIDYDRLADNPNRLGSQLRMAGFTHLLLVQTMAEDPAGGDALARLVQAQRASDPEAALTLTDYLHEEDDGAVRRYRLVTLR